MEPRAYIQSVKGWPISDWAISATMGFKEKGVEVIFVEDNVERDITVEEAIEEIPNSRTNFLVAEIHWVNAYLTRMGVEIPRSINVPQELEGFLGRDIARLSMGEWKTYVQDDLETFPLFIKPDGLAKAFDAGVISDKKYTVGLFEDVPDETPILISEVVNFVSEYRGYVIDGKLVSIKHYTGDFRVFPDVTKFDEALALMENKPAGFSIDFGVTADGQTLLIECNDGWSLGNYGLTDKLYTTLIAKRWREIMSIKR